MKLLFDQNISYRIIKGLPTDFEGSVHVSDVALSDSRDRHIWQYSKENAYTIVTFDSDFYDISLINGHPPKIIWIRAGNLSTNDLITLLDQKKAQIQRFISTDQIESCLELE